MIPIDPAKKYRRPTRLGEVVAWAKDKRMLDAFLREFLDSFYLATSDEEKSAMLQSEPPLTKDEKVDAYLGAVAEHLARTYHLPKPEWTEQKERFLRRAFFPCGLESLKAILLVQSPVAFRRRMIFVDANPLYRPRKDSRGIGESESNAGG